jgi:poly-gamma-glutamate synthesis protein (capsule biosynthesis protein)
LVLVTLAVVAVVAGLLAFASTRSVDPDRDQVRAGEGSTTQSDGSSPSSVPPGSSGATDSSGPDGTQPGTEPPVEKTTTTVKPKGSKPSKGTKAITLAFAGDLLPHMPVNNRAQEYGRESGKPYDYAPMLAPMKPILGAADLAICHMEVPLAPAGEPVTSYPSFGAPAELVDGAKAAGYDGCSTASNHSLDRGRAGLDALLDRFDQNKMGHAGTARTAEEGGGVATVYEVKGVEVANLSYAYGFNGYPVPSEAPWSVNEISADKITADSAKARADGADLVVVSLHWGNEYESDPSGYQRDLAAQVLPSPDIDLVIGHHAHVVQPIEQVEGTYVVYGLGNQLSNQTQAPRRDGMTVVVEAEREGDQWKVSTIEAVPTWVDLGSFRVLPVVDAIADPATPAGLRNELSASYDRTVGIVNGPATPGVTVDPKPPA